MDAVGRCEVRTDSVDATPAPDAAPPETVLESFSLAQAEAELHRALAGSEDPATWARLFGDAAAAIPTHWEQAAANHDERLRRIEHAKETKVRAGWRGLVQPRLSQLEEGGGALPVLGGHADFVKQLQRAFEEATSLEGFTAGLEGERRRWRRSLLGGKKLEALDWLEERVSAGREAHFAKISRQVESTFEPERAAAARQLEADVDTLCLWYRHLLTLPIDAERPEGPSLRWHAVAGFENALVRRLVSHRAQPRLGGGLDALWERADHEVSDSFHRRLRAVAARSTAEAETLAVAEVKLGREWIGRLEQLHLRLSELTPQLRGTVRERLCSATLPAQVRQAALGALDDRAATSLSDWYRNLARRSGLDAAGCKAAAATVADLQPLAALRRKAGRIKTHLAAVQEARAGLGRRDGGPGAR